MFHHRPQDRIQLGGRHKIQCQAPGQVDVAQMIEAVRHPVHACVAFQQPAIDLGEVLIGMPGDERIDAQGMVADDQRHRGAQLLLAGELDDEGIGLRLFELEPRIDQVVADRLGGVHQLTACSNRPARAASASS